MGVGQIELYCKALTPKSPEGDLNSHCQWLFKPPFREVWRVNVAICHTPWKCRDADD
jgi:hypothetical protein